MSAQEFRDGIPAGLPSGVSVGNKTGWIDGVNHDVALIRAPGLPPIGLAVLCSAPGTREEREAGLSSSDALSTTYASTGAAVLASGVTAIAGFAVLIASDIAMLRNFGLVLKPIVTVHD